MVWKRQRCELSNKAIVDNLSQVFEDYVDTWISRNVSHINICVGRECALREESWKDLIWGVIATITTKHAVAGWVFTDSQT